MTFFNLNSNCELYFTLSYDVSENITVTENSDDTYTWTSDGYTFFSMLFGVSSNTMTFSKS